MSGLDNTQISSQKNGRFDRLPRRMQAFLLALLMFAVSAGLLFLGIHGLRAGEPITNMAGRSDWSDSFVFSAATFGLGACLLAVAIGWLKFPTKTQNSDTEPPTQPS